MFILVPDLVVLEVPALDLLVFPGREEVGLTVADGEGPDRADVASEGQLQSTRRKLPQLQYKTQREREREGGGHSIGKIAEHIKVCLVILLKHFFEIFSGVINI